MDALPAPTPDVPPTLPVGLDLSITELVALDLDHPALARAVANVVRDEGALSAFQSFTS